MISLQCGIQNNDTNELIYKTEIDSQTKNKPMVTKKGRRGGIHQEFGIHRYTLLYIRQTDNEELWQSTRSHSQYFVINHRRKVFGKKKYLKKSMYVFIIYV